MRDVLIVFFVVAGLTLFVAGDVLWLVGRQRGHPLDLRRTGMLIAVGVLLVIAAMLIRPA